MSVNRHLANIERHLGIAAAEPEEPGAADEPPTAAG
jgi:hypothetical protein